MNAPHIKGSPVSFIQSEQVSSSSVSTMLHPGRISKAEALLIRARGHQAQQA